MTRGFINTLLLAGSALGALAMGVTQAQAGAFAVREQSAVGQGMSFAGEGTPGMGLSAMFWNPAAVTQATGIWGESHSAIVIPSTTLTAQPGTSPALLGLNPNADNIAQTGFIPSIYGAYRLNPSWYLGLAVNTPFALGTTASVPWSGQQLALHAGVLSIDGSAVIGWKINDMVSVAAGPRVVWFQGKFSRAALALPGTSALPVDLVADDIGLGFTAGITVTPAPGTEIALGYRSQVKLNLEGHNTFPTASFPLSAVLGPFNGTQNELTANATLPDQVNLGVRQRITDTFTLLGTVEWTRWSVLQDVPFTYASGPTPGAIATTLTFNYRDGWFFALGGEYQWNQRTILRAGVAYEISPVTDAVRDTSLPDKNRWWLSAGLTQNLNKEISLDFGYSFIWAGDSQINVVPGHPDFANLLGNSLVANAHGYVQVVSLAFRYRWSDDKPSAIVTKN